MIINIVLLAAYAAVQSCVYFGEASFVPKVRPAFLVHIIL